MIWRLAMVATSLTAVGNLMAPHSTPQTMTAHTSLSTFLELCPVMTV